MPKRVKQAPNKRRLLPRSLAERKKRGSRSRNCSFFLFHRYAGRGLADIFTASTVLGAPSDDCLSGRCFKLPPCCSKLFRRSQNKDHIFLFQFPDWVRIRDYFLPPFYRKNTRAGSTPQNAFPQSRIFERGPFMHCKCPDFRPLEESGNTHGMTMPLADRAKHLVTIPSDIANIRFDYILWHKKSFQDP